MACSRRINSIYKKCEAINGGIKQVIMISTDNIRVNEVTRSGVKFFDSIEYYYGGQWQEVESSSNFSSWGIYNFQKNSASVTSNLTNESSNGAVFVESTLALNFKGSDDAVREEVESLVNNYFFVVYKTMEDRWYILLDEDEQPTVTLTGQTGAQKSDGNFFTVNAVFDNEHFPFEVTNVLYTSLFDSMSKNKSIATVVLTLTDGSHEINSYSNGVCGVFCGRIDIESVEIGYGITTISSNAFSGCTALTSVYLPSTVTMIGSSAFKGCSSLTSIELLGSLSAVSVSTFANCTALESIILGENMKYINSKAFSGCTGIKRLYILNASLDMSDDTPFTNITTSGTMYVPTGHQADLEWIRDDYFPNFGIRTIDI